ncbi:HAMP domain-containing histidine kinase [Bacillus cereus]|uniref:histidine kinase n=1 Tax=Bacillus cereus TaxID=1396 RepID=A0AB34CXL8_BACCE|nr:HAMP domain-containing sensor histidine kinase [Bacillus cereus]KAB2490393.1 HAMP domain-containing histidine kinase [Bacillus cereus]
MKLRVQLLIINLVSMSIIVITIRFCDVNDLFMPEPTGLLTWIILIPMICSNVIYWLLTRPIINSVNNLIELTKQFSDRKFETRHIIGKEPKEFKDLAAAFQQMAKEIEEGFIKLEEGKKARTELIANISHDLRTPLASIQLMIEALQDGIINEDFHVKEQYTSAILKEIQRLNGLINNLFDLSKLELGKEEFHPILTHLDSIVIEVLNSYSILLEEKHINIQVQVSNTLPQVWIMPCKIARVINNLLQNAIRYSPVYGKIDLIVDDKEVIGQVKFIIRDEGKGIASNDQLRIFERFFRTDLSRSSDSGGSGLGLAIAKSLIEMHNGEIGVRNRSDDKQGSEFWFTLPIISEKN